MRITYDPDADALFIELKRASAADNVDIGEGMTADLDKSGNIIAIEVLGARRRYGKAALQSVTFERFPERPPRRAPVPS